MRFTPDKLEVSFIDPVTLYNPINGRKYTLTHSDDTGVLFLTIGLEYDYDAINQDLRDEVLGNWKVYDNSYILFFYVHVGDYEYDKALFRYNTFKSHLNDALKAIFYGDRELLNRYPNLSDTMVFIKFDSSIPIFDNYEFYGYVKDYIIS